MRPLDPFTVPLVGTQLVEASAGTGKTFTMTTLFLRCLLERGLAVPRILVVTFTKAATAELRDRIRRRLALARDQLAGRDGARAEDPLLDAWLHALPNPELSRRRLAVALRSIDEAAVSTIHGFCSRVLREHAFESGTRFGLELVGELRPLVSDVMTDYFVRELHALPLPVLRVVRRELTPERLDKLARLALADRSLRVVPAPGPVPPFASSALEQVVQRARAVFDAAAIAASYAASDLNGNKHGKHVPGRLAEIGVALASPEPELIEDSLLERFDPRVLPTQLKQKGTRLPAHPFLELVPELRAAQDELRSAARALLLRLQHGAIEHARAALGERLQAAGQQSFDDLVQGLGRALDGPSGAVLAAALRERHPVALIDEFQDTDPVQWSIFSRTHRLARGERADEAPGLFLIGDPKQAIYGFRGADVFAYLGAAEQVDGSWTLGTNHRSDPSLVRATNAVFQDVPRPFGIEQIGFRPVAPRPTAEDALRGSRPHALEFVIVPREHGEKLDVSDAALAELVAVDVARLLSADLKLQRGPGVSTAVSAGDVAVLSRTNRQAYELQVELRRRNVRSVLRGAASVLDSGEARELSLVLAALSAPSSGGALRAALSTGWFDVNGNQLHALRTDGDATALDRFAERFHRWHEAWSQRGVARALRGLLVEADVLPRLLGFPGGERKLTNVLHLCELLARLEQEDQLGPAALQRLFEQLRHDPNARGEVAADAAQLRLESDGDAAVLTTMHRSKGLEYPIVFLPFLLQGVELRGDDEALLHYHPSDAAHAATLDLRAKDDPSKAAACDAAREEQLGEALRLAYVALTRGRHRTVVYLGVHAKLPLSPLGRLLLPLGGLPDSEEDLRKVLEARFAPLGDAVRIRSWEPSDVRLPWDSRLAEPLKPALAKRRLPDQFRLTSFSALTERSSELHLEVDPRDVDPDVAANAELVLPVGRPLVPLAGVPRGARVGTLVHELLEQLDFTLPEPALREALAAGLVGAGADLAAHTATLVDGLVDALQTPLAAGAPSLSQLAPARCLREMELCLPIADAAGSELFTAGRLADVLRAEKPAPWPPSYPARVAKLPFAPLRGFLRGFVDLIFEHDGVFYIVDYKTNSLGSTLEDYGPAQLGDAMVEHDYHLQYLFYAVALDRYLAARLPNYDRATQLGGVYYPFLRGMNPARPGHSVFHFRPSVSLVGALSELLRAPTAKGRAVK